MKRSVRWAAVGCALLLAPAVGCAQQAEPGAAANALGAEEQAAGWRLLFDGATTQGWRGFMGRSIDGWQAVDGTLTRVGGGSDIVSVEQFEDFELSLEWQVAPGGNSGILFYVVERPEVRATWQTGPEMQVLDNARHRDGANPLTSAGAAYALYAPARDATRPVGEWNHARVRVQDGRVEHWLNGEKLVEYELGSDDWKARVAASKFAAMPFYGQARRGHIALQDHGDRVAYRNIKIRELR